MSVSAVYNGVFDSLENIKISPLSRAYTFSDGVYEVIPFINKSPIALDLHINRLINSSSALLLNIDIDKLYYEINKLINVASFKNGYIYYQISRGVDSLRSHIHKKDIEHEYFGYVSNLKKQNSHLTIKLCEDIRWKRCDIKTISLLGNVMQMNMAANEGCDEILMFHDGKITEGGSSNVFISDGNVISTPKEDSNILPGITRKLFIDELKKNQIPIEERDIYIKEIEEASTIWLSSSLKGLLPVKKIVNKNYIPSAQDKMLKITEDIFNNKYYNF